MTYKKYGNHPQDVDYRIKLNKYFAEQFCPADVYLEAVKDKIGHFRGNGGSEFQNVMRKSLIGKTRYNSVAGNINGSYSGITKDSPFLRKNLISALT